MLFTAGSGFTHLKPTDLGPKNLVCYLLQVQGLQTEFTVCNIFRAYKDSVLFAMD